MHAQVPRKLIGILLCLCEKFKKTNILEAYICHNLSQYNSLSQSEGTAELKYSCWETFTKCPANKEDRALHFQHQAFFSLELVANRTCCCLALLLKKERIWYHQYLLLATESSHRHENRAPGHPQSPQMRHAFLSHALRIGQCLLGVPFPKWQDLSPDLLTELKYFFLLHGSQLKLFV